MTLRETQQQFALAVADLIIAAHTMGYDVVGGEWWRHPVTAKHNAETGAGIKDSLHCICLAIDLNLFMNGVYLTKTEDYRALGEWWEEYGEKNDMPLRWGGRFNDGGHFSYEHDGRK